MKKVWFFLSVTLVMSAGNYQFDIVEKNNKKRSAFDMSAYVSKNISRKSIELPEEKLCKDTVYLKEGDQKIVIKSNSFGPLPVTVVLYDKNGSILSKSVNEGDILTFFELPVEKIHDGSIVKIYNAFDDILVCKKIKK